MAGAASDSPLIHSVSVAEFDIKIGVTLSHVHPPSKLDSFQKSEIASLCLPDGGHKVREDWTYMIVKDPTTGKRVFGLSFFRNIPDPSQPRGARQMAMLLLLKKPYFLLFKPIVREALERFMDDHEVLAPKTVYDTLKAGLNRSVQIVIFDRHFILNIPSLLEDPFPGASLSTLVSVFKQNVIHLWYAALLGHRILFVGSNGEGVGNSCMAVPILVLPLRGFEEVITPYVQLTDMVALEQSTYICGTSNPVMADFKKLYDVVAYFDTGELVNQKPIKPSSRDKQLVKRVLKGADNGEKWVRRQFFLRTQQFLSEALAAQGTANEQTLPSVGSNAKLFENFSNSDMFKRYSEELKTATDENEALAAFRTLQEAQENEDVGATAVQLMKYYYRLDECLFDASDMEAIVDKGGVDVLRVGLLSTSSQVRKYSTNLLAKLARTLKGQVEIVHREVMPLLVGLLKDKQPVVVLAAATSLQKISTLYIGAKALLDDEQTRRDLCTLLESAADQDVLRYCVAATLIQAYRLFPDSAHPDVNLNILLSSSDKDFVDLITELVDLWGELLPIPIPSDLAKRASALDVPGRAAAPSVSVGGLASYASLSYAAQSPLSEATDVEDSKEEDDKQAQAALQLANPQLLRFLSVLRSGNANTPGMSSVLHNIFKLVSSKRALAIQAAHLCCIELLYQDGFFEASAGHFRVWELAAYLCKTQTGVRRVLESDLIMFALNELSTVDKPSQHLLYLACFLESLAQRDGVCEVLLRSHAPYTLATFIVEHCTLHDAVEPLVEPPPADTSSDKTDNVDNASVSSTNAPSPRAPASSPSLSTSAVGGVRNLALAQQQQRDFQFLCLPLLRCLQYMYRSLSHADRGTFREQVVALGHLVDMEVNLKDIDLVDFQVVLMSLLTTMSALSPDYLDWIVRARDEANADSAAGGAGANSSASPGDDKKERNVRLKSTARPSQPAPAAQNVQHEGWLHKQGWNRIWRKRWFRLMGNSLVYYKTPTQSTSTGIVALDSSVTLSSTKPRVFVLKTRKRSYSLRAETSLEAERWKSALNMTLHSLADDDAGQSAAQRRKKFASVSGSNASTTTPSHRKQRSISMTDRIKAAFSPREVELLNDGTAADNDDTPAAAASANAGDDKTPQTSPPASSVFSAHIRQDSRLRRVGAGKGAGPAKSSKAPVSKPGSVPVLNFRLASTSSSVSTDSQPADTVGQHSDKKDIAPDAAAEDSGNDSDDAAAASGDDSDTDTKASKRPGLSRYNSAFSEKLRADSRLRRVSLFPVRAANAADDEEEEDEDADDTEKQASGARSSVSTASTSVVTSSLPSDAGYRVRAESWPFPDLPL